jgi:glycosyltransferase involved in cell wall biosynthesis
LEKKKRDGDSLRVWGGEIVARIAMLLSNPFAPDVRVYREATSLVKHGHAVTVYAWDRQGKHPSVSEEEGVRVERLHIPAGYGRGAKSLVAFARFGLAVTRCVLSTSFDVVHCHDLDTMPFGYTIARVRGRPVLFDAHEPYSLYLRFPNTLRRLLVLLERWTARRADHVITVTPAMVRRFADLGVRNVTLVANYPHDLFAVQDRSVPQPAKRPLVLGWIGTLKPGNQLELIIEGARQFNARHPDAPLQVLFVGPVLPGYRETLLERARLLGDRITMVGPVPHQEVPRYYQQIDIAIMVDADTPQKRFALNLKLFESMAMGLPIIVQPTGDAPKLINRERCGLVLAKSDAGAIVEALETLSADPEARRAMGRNGQQAVRERYHWGVSERALLKVYDDLLHHAVQRPAEVSTAGEVE